MKRNISVEVRAGWPDDIHYTDADVYIDEGVLRRLISHAMHSRSGRTQRGPILVVRRRGVKQRSTVNAPPMEPTTVSG